MKSNADRTEVKIAYIGGGSRHWAHHLMSDLALCPLITGQLSLYDLDHAAAANNARIGADIFSRPEARTTFHVAAARTPAQALKGADFVVCSIEPGPTQMRYADLEIPARYGIVQPVGDSTGPGGILRALRSIPIKAAYAHLIMKHCPKAWVINYTNPMTLCTAALYAAEPNIKAFGCCHEVFGTQWFLSHLVKDWFGLAASPDRREIELDIAGVNHFTFATAASWRGNDLFPRLRRMTEQPKWSADHTRVAQQRIGKKQWFSSDKLIALDLLRRFGALGAAGDRHLAEFVPWYLTSERALHRWGVICTPFSWRIKCSRQPRTTKYNHATLTPSGEEGVAQLLALLGLATCDTNINMPNRGQMTDAPLGAIVETNAQIRRDRITPVVARPLPPAVAQLVNRIVSVQQLTLQAAMTGDRELAFEALLLDPLVHLPTDKARRMFDQMLHYTAACLPRALR
jgi:alpha-galactosidase